MEKLNTEKGRNQFSSVISIHCGYSPYLQDYTRKDAIWVYLRDSHSMIC